MKTIEEMAHDYLCAEIEHTGMNMVSEHDAVRMAFLFAEAMQSEAEKRKPTPNADPMRKVREAEWQPDWSQAPKGALTWAINSQGKATWATYDKDGNYLETLIAPSFNYQGDWKDSLRKRP